MAVFACTRVLTSRAIRRGIVTALTAVSTAAACGGDGDTAPNPIAGRYTATTLRVTPAGQPEVDVLAAGGSLTLTIADNNVTSGEYLIPASLNGGTPLPIALTGAASRQNDVVTFQQVGDSFLRDLSWRYAGGTLRVDNQTVNGASFTVVLTR